MTTLIFFSWSEKLMTPHAVYINNLISLCAVFKKMWQNPWKLYACAKKNFVLKQVRCLQDFVILYFYKTSGRFISHPMYMFIMINILCGSVHNTFPFVSVVTLTALLLHRSGLSDSESVLDPMSCGDVSESDGVAAMELGQDTTVCTYHDCVCLVLAPSGWVAHQQWTFYWFYSEGKQLMLIKMCTWLLQISHCGWRTSVQ